MKNYTLYIAEIDNLPEDATIDELAFLYYKRHQDTPGAVHMFQVKATGMEEATERLRGQAFNKGWSIHNTLSIVVDGAGLRYRDWIEMNFDEANNELFKAKDEAAKWATALHKLNQTGGNQ